MLALRDADLVAHAQKGNVEAIGELYERHRVRIFRYVWMSLLEKFRRKRKMRGWRLWPYGRPGQSGG